MKFLLTAVNAKFIHSNPAVYSLRAYAGERLQEHIEIAQYTINNRTEDVLADIYLRKPDVIGFSCYIWNWNMIQDILEQLHKILQMCIRDRFMMYAAAYGMGGLKCSTLFTESFQFYSRQPLELSLIHI